MTDRILPLKPEGDLERMFRLVMVVQDAARAHSGGWLAEHDLYLKDLKVCEEKTYRLIHHIVMELAELQESMNWKIHKKWQADAVDRDNVRVEVVDILHFVFEIAVNWGITPAMLRADFETKAAENVARQERGY